MCMSVIRPIYMCACLLLDPFMSVIRPIYICACLLLDPFTCVHVLLDPFPLYLEMSVVFDLSLYRATANSGTVGNENVLVGFFLEGGWGRF